MVCLKLDCDMISNAVELMLILVCSNGCEKWC